MLFFYIYDWNSQPLISSHLTVCLLRFRSPYSSILCFCSFFMVMFTVSPMSEKHKTHSLHIYNVQNQLSRSWTAQRLTHILHQFNGISQRTAHNGLEIGSERMKEKKEWTRARSCTRAYTLFYWLGMYIYIFILCVVVLVLILILVSVFLFWFVRVPYKQLSECCFVLYTAYNWCQLALLARCAEKSSALIALRGFFVHFVSFLLIGLCCWWLRLAFPFHKRLWHEIIHISWHAHCTHTNTHTQTIHSYRPTSCWRCAAIFIAASISL